MSIFTFLRVMAMQRKHTARIIEKDCNVSLTGKFTQDHWKLRYLICNLSFVLVLCGNDVTILSQLPRCYHIYSVCDCLWSSKDLQRISVDH